MLSTYLTTQPLSISTLNASIRTLVCPAGSISVSTTNNAADKAIQVFNNNGTIFLSPGNGITGNYNSTTIVGDNVLGYYGGSSQNTGTLNITQWGTTSNGIRLNANIVTITDTLNVTSALNVASNPVATQNYVTSRNYITSKPGDLLKMMSNSISFTNNGAGITWANNNSQIYDNGNLYITTDDYLNISCQSQQRTLISVEICIQWKVSLRVKRGLIIVF